MKGKEVVMSKEEAKEVFKELIKFYSPVHTGVLKEEAEQALSVLTADTEEPRGKIEELERLLKDNCKAYYRQGGQFVVNRVYYNSLDDDTTSLFYTGKTLSEAIKKARGEK